MNTTPTSLPLSGDVSRTIHLTSVAADVRRRIPPSAMSSASLRRRLPLLDSQNPPSRATGLCLATIAAALLLLPAGAKAAAFTSGSTGAYGAMNITADTTLNLPTNGIFHCTTINIDAGVTLRFNHHVGGSLGGHHAVVREVEGFRGGATGESLRAEVV